jgi:meso-butanediol dehydrogenase / (S,S)-butanediol dehydrogenase / diacetyl reductase
MSDILSNKVALITGGGSGLGATMAKRFSDHGANIVITGRREKYLKKVAEETGAIFVPGNVTNAEHLSLAVDRAIEAFGGLDIVVANAGIIAGTDVASTKASDWQGLVDTNLTGVMLTAKAALPALIKRGGGAIVNISSVAGLMGVGEAAAYCTTKSALLGLTRSMAIDYGYHNIRVNTLCPGWFHSEMSDMEMAELAQEKNITIEAAIERVTKYLPLKRMADPDEIAACAEFLVSDMASFVTGTVLVADGGGAIVDVGMLGFL